MAKCETEQLSLIDSPEQLQFEIGDLTPPATAEVIDTYYEPLHIGYMSLVSKFSDGSVRKQHVRYFGV